ncbi:GIY-YIG nuclease family protein [uncultured Clostridium sp.]|uniref:GIY-YIG nuclease family protein n=2 Tax=uncultured Clostridium sp. TaxID=59620 RepID=UPI00262B9098|nr:GIY-YIG nuclease family protein [uncultured Clostridium sp.]
MKRSFKIYKITCKINNKVYIGQTIETLTQRFNRHMGYQKDEHDTKFYRAIGKYGRDNFYIELLEEVSNQKELDEREYYWICFYDSVKKGYNTKNSIGKCGGDTLSNHPNKELISKKISNSKIGDKNPMRINGGLKGERNGMYGKHLTEEQKSNISKKLKGRTRSEDECRKTSESLKGVPKSKSHIENLKKSHLGDDYYREVVIVDEYGNIIERFKNKSEYYRGMAIKYNVGRTFLELWIKNKKKCKNRKNLERFKPLENKRALYYDEFITENV